MSDNHASVPSPVAMPSCTNPTSVPLVVSLAPTNELGPETINRIVRRIQAVRAYAARVDEWANRERQRAERQESWLLHRYTALLEYWLRGELSRRSGRGRTVHLPAGKLSFRQQPPRANIIDNARLVAWCEANLPSALRLELSASGPTVLVLRDAVERFAVDKLVASVQLTPLKQYITESGDVPDGIEWLRGGDRLLIA